MSDADKPSIFSDNREQSQEGVIKPTRLYSGIQPTGDIHIGNYLGAVAIG